MFFFLFQTYPRNQICHLKIQNSTTYQPTSYDDFRDINTDVSTVSTNFIEGIADKIFLKTAVHRTSIKL